MSLASIATNLYTIQSRKNVPLKTAFSMMIREDMAMRFSVYNLVRIITKSEFLATVAQTAYGKRTPLQKAQDEEDRKREMNEQKFKVYTQVTFARINNRLNLLTSITERNSQLIMNLYSELGYFRGQRKVSFNSSAGFATRVMLPSKTVKTKIEEIEKQLYELSNIKKTRVRPRGATAKKKTGAGAQTNQDESGLLSSLLPILARNPSALAAVAGVAGAGIGAIGLGTLGAMAATSGGRVIDRLVGNPTTYYDDSGKEITNPLAEKAGQLIDPGLIGVGAGVLTPLTAVGVTAGASVMQRRALENRIANRTAQIPLERRNERRLFRAYQQGKDLNAAGLQQTAEQRDIALKTRAERMRKQGRLNSGLLSQWAKISPVLRGLSKLSVGLAAADVAFTVGEMGNHVANRASGNMSEEDFKKKMTTGYAQLISTVGITGFTTAIGAAVGSVGGTLALPFIGTIGGGLAGGIAGGISGGILAIILEEDEGEDTVMRDLGEKVFELIHEGKVPSISPAVTPSTSAQGTPTTAAVSRRQSGVTSPTGPRNASRAVRNNNPGNIEFANQREAIGSDGRFAIFPTREAGLRALETQIRLDIRRGDTLEKFISEYAPKSENDTRKYINYVSSASGVQPYEKIPESKIPLVMAAIIQMEGGNESSAYYANSLRSGYSTGARVALVTADTVRTSPPPLVSIANAPVSTPPSGEQTAASTQDIEARIDAKVGINYADIVKKQMTAGMGALNQKIVDIKKTTTVEFPFTSNPESSISSYRV